MTIPQTWEIHRQLAGAATGSDAAPAGGGKDAGPGGRYLAALFYIKLTVIFYINCEQIFQRHQGFAWALRQ